MMAPVGIRGEEQAVPAARLVGAQVMRVLRHLGLERIADEERRHAAEHDHDDDPPVAADLSEHLQRVPEPEARRGSRHDAVAQVARIGDGPEEDRERHIDQHVREEPPRRPEQQHEPTAHGRPQQDGEVAGRGVQTDRALKLRGPDHVMEDELRGGHHRHTGRAVEQEDHHRVPHPERPGEEEQPPRQRRHHEQDLARLDQLPAVIAVGERARVHGEEQERHPVADDGKAREHGRVKRLVDDPVADDVLDVVGRHRGQAQREVAPVVPRVKRRESGSGWWGGGGPGRRNHRQILPPGRNNARVRDRPSSGQNEYDPHRPKMLNAEPRARDEHRLPEKLEGLTARQRALLVALLSAASIVYAMPIGTRPLWNQDEARVVLLAEDTLRHGPRLPARVRDAPYLNKPPLFFWTVALGAWPTGRVSDREAPIPSIAAALATLLGVFAIGRRLSGAHTGFIALVVLATSPGFFFLSHEVLPDMMFTAWLTWALYFLLRALECPAAPSLLIWWASTSASPAPCGPRDFRP